MGWGDDHHTRVFLFDPRYSAKRKIVDIDEHLLLEPQKRGTANRKTLDNIVHTPFENQSKTLILQRLHPVALENYITSYQNSG